MGIRLNAGRTACHTDRREAPRSPTRRGRGAGTTTFGNKKTTPRKMPAFCVPELKTWVSEHRKKLSSLCVPELKTWVREITHSILSRIENVGKSHTVLDL